MNISYGLFSVFLLSLLHLTHFSSAMMKDDTQMEDDGGSEYSETASVNMDDLPLMTDAQIDQFILENIVGDNPYRDQNLSKYSEEQLTQIRSEIELIKMAKNTAITFLGEQLQKMQLLFYSSPRTQEQEAQLQNITRELFANEFHRDYANNKCYIYMIRFVVSRWHQLQLNDQAEQGSFLFFVAEHIARMRNALGLLCCKYMESYQAYIDTVDRLQSPAVNTNDGAAASPANVDDPKIYSPDCLENMKIYLSTSTTAMVIDEIRRWKESSQDPQAMDLSLQKATARPSPAAQESPSRRVRFRVEEPFQAAAHGA